MADKYYRLISFVMNICPEPVRELFIKNAKADPKPGTPYTTLPDYLAFRKQDIDNLKRKRILLDDQYDLLYPKTGVVDEMQWDITLLVLLSINLFKFTAVEKRNMVDIRKVKNDLQHISGTTTLTDKQFNDYWNQLEMATLELARAVSGSPYADTIESKITDTKINNMPQLKQKHDIEEVKENTKESSKILRGVCVTKPASSGHKVNKRLRTIDHILTKLQANFEMTMNLSRPEHFDAPSAEVSDIKTKLRNNHLVIVAGHGNIEYLQIALVAIRSMKYDNRRCMEITNPTDWRHIDPEDVELVLCLDPFGKGSYDENKSSCMSDLFTNMQYTVKREEGRNALDIVIVTDVAVLNECRKHHDHEILEEVVTVFPPTTEQQPCDLTKVPDEIRQDPYDLELYETALRDGKEIDRSIRINIVGNYRQGKTSLVRRLIGHEIDTVESTNGIEVEHYTCQRTPDGILTYSKADDMESDIVGRLLSVIHTNVEDRDGNQ